MAKHLEPLITPTPSQPLYDHEQPLIDPKALVLPVRERNFDYKPGARMISVSPHDLEPQVKTKKPSLYARLQIDKAQDNVVSRTSHLDPHSDPHSKSEKLVPPVQPTYDQICKDQDDERIKLLKQIKIKPEIMEFFKKRALQKSLLKPEPKSQTSSEASNSDSEILPIDPTTVRTFPHMSALEPEKLKWTGNIVLAQEKSAEVERSARFNFNGQIITIEMERELKTWDQGLHHHGEEMERPGYTLDELFTLSRSTNLQQRTIGFSILSNIFKRAHDGEFDLSLSKSIFEVFLELDPIFTLRIGFDQPDASALNSSLDCLGSLLYPEMEESCLDYSYFWSSHSQPQPLIRTKEQRNAENKSLFTQPNAEEVLDSELKDSNYLKLDLLDFLIVRTDLLQRIHYVIRNYYELLNEAGVFGILKILSRVARHSPDALTLEEGLIGLIFNFYMNPNYSPLQSDKRTRASNLIGIPLGAAIKLFRIIISSCKENAKKIHGAFDIFMPILAYLSYDSWMEQNKIMEVETLVLESFKLWHAFLKHGIGVEEFSRFLPVIFKCLQMYMGMEKMCSFDLNHMAHVFGLIGAVLDNAPTCDHLRDLISFVEQLTIKICCFLSHKDSSYLIDFDSALEALGNALSVLKLYKDKCNELGNSSNCARLINQLQTFVDGPGFERISENCVPHSLLLTPFGDPTKETFKYPENIYPASSYLFGGYLVPIMSKGTPFHILFQIFQFVKRIDTHLLDYISKLTNTVFPFRTNYYLRFELNFLSQITLPLSVVYKLIPQVQTGDEGLLSLFLETFINKNENSFSLYSSVLITNQEENHLEFKDLSRKLVPINWFYSPFHAMKEFLSTANSIQDLPQNELTKAYSKVVKDTQILLEFITTLLKKDEELLVGSPQDLQMLYMGICTIFMLGTDVFFDPAIQTSLVDILKLILSCKLIIHPKKCNVFTHKMKNDLSAALTEDEFTTFYQQLIGAYSQFSYGNPVFGDYLLLPLRSNEQKETRKAFWTSDCVTHFRAKSSQSVIPLPQYFGSDMLPPEDPEMLEWYERLLRCINSSTHELLQDVLKFCSSK